MAGLPSLHDIVAIADRWFSDLPDAVRREVLARARRRSLAPGERLYSRGEKADGLYCVIEGSVRVSGISREGHETVLDFYGPGSWFGDVATFSKLTRAHDAEGHTPAVLLHVGPDDIEELFRAQPLFLRACLRLESQRLYLLLAALAQYSVQSMEQRLASRLLLLAVHHGAESGRGLRIGLRLSQETLGRLIGATRQRVNQIFKAWEGAGLVEHQYGHVVLLNVAALEQLARP